MALQLVWGFYKNIHTKFTFIVSFWLFSSYCDFKYYSPMTSLMAGSLRFAVSLILVGVLLDFHPKHNLEDIFSWLRKHLFISILIRVLKYQERIFKTIGSIFLYKRYYNIPWPTLQKKLRLRSHMMLQRTFVWDPLFLPYLPHALFVIRKASIHSVETGLGWLCWVKTKWGRVSSLPLLTGFLQVNLDAVPRSKNSSTNPGYQSGNRTCR